MEILKEERLGVFQCNTIIDIYIDRILKCVCVQKINNYKYQKVEKNGSTGQKILEN